MPRTYDVQVASLTVGVPAKWLDNLLSHHDVPGVTRSRQGVRRRIDNDGMLAIELVRILNADLKMPVALAVALVRGALESRSATTMRVTTPSGLTIGFPLPDIERRLREQLIGAMEGVGRVRRGRPPAS